MIRKSILAAAIVFLCLTTFAKAGEMTIQSSPPPAGQKRSFNIDGTTFTTEEVGTLFEGLHKALDDKDTSIHVTIDTKKAADMPAYDPKWHCNDARVKDGVPQIDFTLSDAISHDQNTIKTAIEACVFLGLAQVGYAGPNWKALYDRFAAEDAALGATATDPFMNRRRLAIQLAQFYQMVVSGKLTSSPAPSASP